MYSLVGSEVLGTAKENSSIAPKPIAVRVVFLLSCVFILY